MASSNTLRAKIAPILTLRGVLARAILEIHTLRDMGYEKNSSLDLSNFSDICDALKLCRDPTSPVEIELLLLLLKLKF